jgi:hypothetical protein
VVSVPDRHPELKEALDRGRAIVRDRLDAKAYELAKDCNVTGVIFALKAEHTYREEEPL